MKRLSVLLLLIAQVATCNPALAGYPVCCGYKVYPAQAAPAQQATPAVPPPTDPGWRAKFLDVKFGIAKLEADSRDYQAAIQSLDPQQPVQGAQAYGVPYGASYAATGNTLYESYRGFGGNYLMGSNQGSHPSVLANQARAFTDKIADLVPHVFGAVQAGAQLEAEGNLRVAQVNAQRDLVVATLKASTPDEVRRAVTQFQHGPQQTNQGPGPGVIVGAAGGDPAASVRAILSARCISCHSDTNKQGGLDLTVPPDDDVRKSVANRLLHPDPAERMPFKATATGHGAGDALPFEELRTLLRYF